MAKITNRRIGKRKVSERKNVSTDNQTVIQTPFKEALELFVTAKKAEDMRPRTIDDYYKHVEWLMNYLKEFYPDVTTIDQLTPSIIRAYINYLKNERKPYQGNKSRQKKKKGLSINTINIRLRTLRVMCRFWTADDYLDKDPMENIKILRSDTVDDVNGFTEQEMKALMGVLDTRKYTGYRDKIIILLLLDTGIRISELANLRIDQLDHKNLTMFIPPDVAKNRKGRTVPVSRKVMKMLLDLHEENKEYFESQEHIFLTAFGDPIIPDTFRRRLARYKEEANIEKATPHMFRHTFARDYILNGGDLFTLQLIIGHKQTETTRRYIQMDEKHVKQQHMRFSPATKYI